MLARLNNIADRLAAHEDFGLTLLRIVVGGALIPHGAQKLFGAFGGYGPGGTAGWLESIGFAPGMAFALAIGLLEFAGGAALVLGFATRPVAAAVTLFMATAISIHWPNGYFWNLPNGGWEVPMLWGTAALYLVLRGAGPVSLDARLFARGRNFG